MGTEAYLGGAVNTDSELVKVLRLSDIYHPPLPDPGTIVKEDGKGM